VSMRLRDRDAEFEPFYAAEAGRLRSLALLLTGDRDHAADLTQEALLRTYESWPRIRTDPGAYTRRALVNLYRNWIRRRILERRHRNAALALDERSWPNSPEDALRVADVLRVLSPIRRATVLLRFYEDMSEAQIADVLGRPIGTVKSDIHRALKTLRPLLEDDIKEPA
jgi:RNA polymerase sigma-70 factor (sigma-E family)